MRKSVVLLGLLASLGMIGVGAISSGTLASRAGASTLGESTKIVDTPGLRFSPTQPLAVTLPDISVPPALEPIKRQLWTPQGLLFFLIAVPAIGWVFSEDTRSGKLASARWGGNAERRAARRVAIRQINERRRNGLTTWINAPVIRPLAKPQLDSGKPIRRFRIKPRPSTVFVPDCQRGTAVCGAPGSGKTFSVIDPMVRSVIEQGMPLCLYDFKFPGGQAEAHADYARRHGYRVHVFAPGFEGSEVCNLLDFLDSADDAETAGQIAKVLNKNFSLNGGRGSDDPFFQMSGDQLIKAVLQLAKATAFPDFLTCQKILALDSSGLIDRVKAADISPWIRTSWDQFTSMRQSEKTSSSVAATASLMFTHFVSPDILPCLMGPSTIPLDLTGKQLLIFGMDQNRRDIIGPILATVLHMLITRNVAVQRREPLAVFLDELPTLSLPSLVNWLNESRSAGFCGVLGYQNMTQLEKAYGKELARAILSGCNTKFIFNPGEYESADYFSKYLGETEVRLKQKSRSTSRTGNSRSIADQERTRKLLSPDEILKLPTGRCIFINPAYASKTEAQVPLQLQVKICPDERRKEQQSRAVFPRLLQAMRRRAQARGILTISPADIQAREAAVDQILPQVASGTSSNPPSTPPSNHTGSQVNRMVEAQVQGQAMAQLDPYFDQMAQEMSGAPQPQRYPERYPEDPPF